MGHTAGLGAVEEKKNPLPLLEIEPNFSVFHPQAYAPYLLHSADCLV